MSVRGSPLSFWIPVLVLFPGDSQRRERLVPGAAGVIMCAPVVGGICLLDLGSVSAVDGGSAGLV